MKNKIRYGKIVANILLATIAILGTIFIVPSIIMFFLPFVIGWFIALIANPPVKFLAEKLKIKRKAGSAIVIILVIASILLVGYGIGVILFEQIRGYMNSLPEMWKTLEQDLVIISQKFDIFLNTFPEEVRVKVIEMYQGMDVYIADIVANMGTPTVLAVSSFAKNLTTMIISVIMCVLSAYFFIAERDYIVHFCEKNMPISIQKKWKIVMGSMKNTIGGYIKAQIKIEVWMYLMLVIGLFILKIEYALIIALGIAILDIIPFFGTGAVLIPWAIINIISVDYKTAVGLLIIWGVGQLFRQIIQPKIVGDTIGVPPIPTLVLLFVGFKVGSVIGMIIALPIGMIVARLWQDGAFDTIINSVKLLIKGINEFRKLDQEDLSHLEDKTSEGKNNDKKL